MVNEAEEAARVNDVRKLYQITKTLSGKHRGARKPLRDSEDQLLTGDEEQRKRWKEYFSNLLNGGEERQEEEEIDVYVREELREINIQAPTREEIKTAIKSLKNGKAPGCDNIPAEMLKADPDTAADLLLPLLERIWNEERLPEDWNRGVLIKLPKTGDLTKCSNWRGITLLSVPSKILSRIILNRIQPQLERSLRREQYGFRPGRSCVDLINTIRIVIEQSLEYQNSLYLVFVDFVKAFDQVKRSKMWSVMEEKGVPRKIISLAKAMYSSYKCQVEHNGKLSESFMVSRGVRQGCLLSPLLFILVLDKVLKESERGRRRGIQWGLRARLEDVDYADDVCLLAHRLTDIKGKVTDLVETAEQMGLQVNTGKTKIMALNPAGVVEVKVEDEALESVEEFRYLGSMVSMRGGADEDVECRIRKAKSVFAQLKRIWQSREIQTKTKLTIFNSNVKSVLLYACETWKVSKVLTRKLQVFLNRCLRRILHIRWPVIVSNEELWRRSEQRPVELEIKARKWRWIGHTLRLSEDSITRQALEWNPQGQRRRGRPRKTWRSAVLEEAGQGGRTWGELKELARNRVRWRAHVEALCSLRR